MMADNDQIVAEFKRRFRIAQDAEADNRATFKTDRRFVYDDRAQWDGSNRSRSRPTVTVNRLQVFARNIVNEAREAAVGIKVHPTDGLEGRDLAEVVAGMIRACEYTSNAADDVYPGAFEDSVTGGFGEMRVTVDYESPDSFQQIPKIVRITDPLTVLRDPFYTHPTGSDARWLIIHTRMDRETFAKRWPDAAISDVSGADSAFWVDQAEGVLVAEYFEVVDEDEKLHQLKDGSTVWDSEIEKGQRKQIAQTRESCRRRVMWSMIGGEGVLEGPTEFPASMIPVVRMPGREWYDAGIRHTCGACHYAKDAQRLYNAGRTWQLERMALSPKAPFIGYKGQFSDPKWKTANTEMHAYLESDTISVDGKPVPLPQRTQPIGIDPALSEEIALSAEEIKATTGIFDANLGAQGNESSGRAILARQQQGSRANADFVANRNMAVRQVGALLLEIIPRIYDTERVVRIIGMDGGQDMIWIKKEFIGRDGRKHFYDLSKAKFDITLDVGPSYQTRRQEAAIAMQESLRAMPAIGEVAPDLVVESQDWPGSDKMAARLRQLPGVKATMTPQEAQEYDSMGQGGQEQQKPAEPPPEMVAELQKLQAENQELKTGAQIEAAKLELDRYKIDQDNATRIRVAIIQADNDLQKQTLAHTAQAERDAAAKPTPGTAQDPEVENDGQGIAPEGEVE